MIALVQLAVAVAVVTAPCPGYPAGTVSGCYVPETRTVYVAPHQTRRERDLTIAHEYGHAWYYDHLNTQTGRRWIRRTLGFKTGHPFWGAGVGHDVTAPGEAYADAYAAVALGWGRAWGPTYPLPAWRLALIRASLPSSAYAILREEVTP